MGGLLLSSLLQVLANCKNRSERAAISHSPKAILPGSTGSNDEEELLEVRE